jgi:hypothetical protein
MLIRQAYRLLRWRQLLLVAVVVAALLLSTGVVQRRLAGTCPAPPRFRPDVPAAVRAQIEDLYARGLLYCTSSKELANLTEPVYWGSDGMSSVLFFQPEDFRGLGVVDYAFGSELVPTPPGDARLPGFLLDAVGRPTFENQAPEGSGYFYRLDGAPGEADAAVRVDIRGPAVTNPGVSGRNFFRDLQLLASLLQGRASSERRDTRVTFALPIVPDRWRAVPRRAINPQLAGDAGEISTAVLRKIGDALQQPTLYQTASGPLGSTVWVAGVLSDTNPSLVLAVLADGPAEAMEPIATGLWADPAEGGMRLKHFAFPPLPEGQRYQARYWSDPRRRADAPPDFTWQVEFPAGAAPTPAAGSH